MFSHVNAINAQNPSAPRLFPMAALAVSGASDNAPVKLNMDAVISTAEALGHRGAWAETTPGSVLLLPAGQSTGAVADVLGVVFDDKTDTITLELDVVHKPHTISEFEPHDKQTLEVDEAHYHFATAPGVSVDAQAFLGNLKGSEFAVEGGWGGRSRWHDVAMCSCLAAGFRTGRVRRCERGNTPSTCS